VSFSFNSLQYTIFICQAGSQRFVLVTVTSSISRYIIIYVLVGNQ